MNLILKYPAVVVPMFLTSFLPWYIGVAPKRIVVGAYDYMKAFGEIFSFVFLFKTLLSPWKAIRGAYPKYFNISLISQAFALNMISRLAGMVVRLILILVGIVFELTIMIVTVAILLVWYGFPVVAVAHLAYVFF